MDLTIDLKCVVGINVPVPDLFSAGAERMTELRARVRRS